MVIRDRFFRHPYLYSASVVARACVCLATILWGGFVLFHANALGQNPNYARMLTFVGNEDAWAWAFGILAGGMLWRLLACKPPRGVGIVAYAILALFWSYLWWGLVMSDKPWPAGASSGTVVALLALYGFISNPRPLDDPPPRDKGECPLTGVPCKRALRHDEAGG